jgi:hypothetical protein
MARQIVNHKTGPEAIIQAAVIKMLKDHGWWVKIMHGSVYQTGVPDLFCAKRTNGTRWVEIKNPISYKFTPAQIQDFHAMSAQGVGIWILTAATEQEYNKLFLPPNWWTFLQVAR